ncbi:hypothetical protein GCK72_014900 [Caenorhabditis remanei]|uniref:Origin recognition complex subunit 5 C-terminal domain-containing protein n=2 Tax=Caenorhabditis remanei TaxID=31234 RepID=A0A6A5GVP7_CAERE|nr:hypothetical protein GCK72_014900 [Caenorhabditis remanei]KAF1758442.1 hypothetical protein GCK72_014900 [Caenorhabditis remanei]
MERSKPELERRDGFIETSSAFFGSIPSTGKTLRAMIMAAMAMCDFGTDDMTASRRASSPMHLLMLLGDGLGLEHAIQDENSEVKSLGEKMETNVNLYEPVDENTTHLACWLTTIHKSLLENKLFLVVDEILVYIRSQLKQLRLIVLNVDSLRLDLQRSFTGTMLNVGGWFGDLLASFGVDREMNESDIKRLRMLLYNNSRSISHVHVFGEDGSGRSEIVRQVLNNPEHDWICVFGDFLYADGSLKLLLESLATSLGFKTRGDKAERFINNLYENVDWPDENNKKIIIFLDNAQSIVDYPPAPLQCFLESYKAINDLTVRFVTSAPSCFTQYHINLIHLSVIGFHIATPSQETTKCLISKADSSIDPKFINFAIQTLFMYCKSPNTLFSIISDAWEMYSKRVRVHENGPKFDATLASKYLLIAAFCASNNPQQADSRYFVKNHGKDKRSEKKELRAEENRLAKELGPKPAELQRIICIYETFLKLNETDISGFDIKNVIASLDSMGLVSVMNRNNLDTPKIKCLISLETAHRISGSLNLELRNYLEHAT